MTTVRNAAELAVDDVVRTPSGREATVVRFYAGRVIFRYADSGAPGDVSLMPHWVTLIRRAPPAPLPRDYFKGDWRPRV